MEMLQHPALPVLLVCSALLVVKMIVVGHITGITRIRLKAVLNPEDAESFRTGVPPATTEHPAVERGLRAHRNDLEATLPFLAIGYLYLLTNPGQTTATVLFLAFTAFRTLFSVFYFAAFQPWRSLSFLAGEACLLVMLVQMLLWGLPRLF